MASFLAAGLALIVLETVVTSKSAQGNLGSFETLIVGATRWLVDPAVPGIPQRNSTSSSSTSSTQTKKTSSTKKGG